MVNAHNDRDDEIMRINTKLANLEDKSRQNNIKIRGIPESVKLPELKNYFINLLKASLPEAPLEDLFTDYQGLKTSPHIYLGTI